MIAIFAIGFSFNAGSMLVEYGTTSRKGTFALVAILAGIGVSTVWVALATIATVLAVLIVATSP